MNYTLYVGLQKDSDGNQITPADAADMAAAIEHDTAEIFGGYSAIPVYGGWINPNHVLVREKSLRIDVEASDIPRDKVIAWAESVKFKFRQSSVLLVETESTGTFV